MPGSIPKDASGNYKLTKSVFEDYSRRPSVHANEPIAFSAKVLQVIEGNTTSSYRMAVDSNSNYVIYVKLDNSKRGTRILENDVVNVVATFEGLMTYESTLGAPITIPQCTASSVAIPGKSNTSAQKNAGGTYKVTKSNYESFARNEQQYMDQQVSFRAKVVQVVDSSSGVIYRLAVDKSYDAIFLGTISSENLDVRILEDDIVIRFAVFGGSRSLAFTKIDILYSVTWFHVFYKFHICNTFPKAGLCQSPK